MAAPDSQRTHRDDLDADALAWLEACADRIDLDLPLLLQLPQEFVDAELREEGQDVSALIERIRAQMPQDAQRHTERAPPTAIAHGSAPPKREARSSANLRSAARRLRWLSAAAVLALVLYGGLWVGSRALTPETVVLASVEEYGAELAALATSLPTKGGPATEPAAPQQIQDDLTEGARLLREARVTTLGLFPRYDSETAARAQRALEQAFATMTGQTEPPAPDGPANENHSGEATRVAFFIAKALLMQGEQEAARPWLRFVATMGEPPLREEARRLARLNENAF